jgi:hypothetical protein
MNYVTQLRAYIEAHDVDGVKCIDGAFLRLGALDIGLFMAPN